MKVFYGATIPLDKCPERMSHHRPWLFRDSLKKFGVEAVNLNTTGQFTNNRDANMALMLPALRSVPPTEVVLLTDAYDVFFCCGVDEIECKFREFNQPIVFQMEANRWPVGRGFGEQDLDRYGQHPEAPTRYRYINGGGLIGFAEAIEEFYVRVWDKDEYCNQFCMNRELIRHPEWFKGRLDYCCEIFQALFDPQAPELFSTLRVWNGRVHNKETETCPCLVHGNGGFTHHLEALWRQLAS